MRKSLPKTPLLQILRDMSPDQRDEFALMAGTTVSYLYQLAGCNRKSCRATLTKGIADASVLLLDEPHAALDELGQELLWQHIQRWQTEGRTLLVVCHDLNAVRKHIPQTLLIKSSGNLLAPTEQLINPPQVA